MATTGETSAPEVTAEEQLDRTFAALANHSRRAILAQLAYGPASVNELAEPLEMSLPAVSKHLKVLERSGLIERHRKAQFRPCSLNAKPLSDAIDWAEQQRRIWNQRFNQLDAYLQSITNAQSITKE